MVNTFSLPNRASSNKQLMPSSHSSNASGFSGLKYREVSISHDKEEIDDDFGCVLDCDPPSVVVVRRSSASRSPFRKDSMRKSEDEHDDSMALRRASRTSRYV